MFTLEVTFYTPFTKPRDQESFRDRLYPIEGDLERRGQLLGDPSVFWSGGALKMICQTPEPTSLDKHNVSAKVRDVWESLRAMSLRAPRVVVLGRSAHAPKVPDWRRQKQLFYLLTCSTAIQRSVLARTDCLSLRIDWDSKMRCVRTCTFGRAHTDAWMRSGLPLTKSWRFPRIGNLPIRTVRQQNEADGLCPDRKADKESYVLLLDEIFRPARE